MWQDNIKRKLVLLCGRILDLSDSGLGQLANSCEHYCAPSYFTLCGDFFQLTVYLKVMQ